MPPWMIQKIREEQERQEREDRLSWERMIPIERESPFARPPEDTPNEVPDDGMVRLTV